ncbi:hypothetical protein JW865_05865, partial [Candidatus Bathyarchaeota archaeon]|nr:hypothetical protein [Candidatus Bathyarchaeota archaeon]
MLTKKLLDYGFEEKEAEIYIFLSSAGPSPARIIARRFNFNRMKAYRILKNLEKKGIIQSVMSRPIKYLASPLNEVLSNKITETKNQLDNMEKNENNIIEEWTNLVTTNNQKF